MQVEEESPKQYVDIARVPDKEMRPERPVPLGLRPGRSSASLPGLTISTYGLRRAPRIRSVLATTHHAPIYEIGSNHLDKQCGSVGSLYRSRRCGNFRTNRRATAEHEIEKEDSRRGQQVLQGMAAQGLRGKRVDLPVLEFRGLGERVAGQRVCEICPAGVPWGVGDQDENDGDERRCLHPDIAAQIIRVDPPCNAADSYRQRWSEQD